MFIVNRYLLNGWVKRFTNSREVLFMSKTGFGLFDRRKNFLYKKVWEISPLSATSVGKSGESFNVKKYSIIASTCIGIYDFIFFYAVNNI